MWVVLVVDGVSVARTKRPVEETGEAILARAATGARNSAGAAKLALYEDHTPIWALPQTDGASRTRTGDLLGAIQALFQLSYSPVAAPPIGGAR